LPKAFIVLNRIQSPTMAAHCRNQIDRLTKRNVVLLNFCE